MIRRVALLAVMVAACSAPVAVERSASPIVNGFDPEDADGTVSLGYFIWGAEFVSMCSGSLVAPNLVLTAKHCVPNWRDCRALGLQVGFGPDGLDDQVRVAEAVCTPNSCTNDCPPNWNFAYEDLALLVLQRDVDFQPYGIPWEGDDLEVGQTLRLIGYGRTELGVNGHRLETDDEVTAVMDDEFNTMGYGVCNGDSGGTALDEDGRVVGILVRGVDDGCGVRPNRFTALTRVEYWLDVVEEGFRLAQQCTPRSVEECDGWDNDCDGVVDEGCGLEGEPCDPSDPTTGCAAGFFCSETGCGEGVCAEGLPGEGRRGETCEESSDCETLVCADTGGGLRCTRGCVPGGGMCGLGEVCAGPDPTCAKCVDESLSGDGPRGLGEPCDRDRDCVSGSCLSTHDGRYCTESCGGGDPPAACPSGWRCEYGRCVRGDPGDVGEPCHEDGDCASGLCGRWDEEWACTRPCGEAEQEDCPEGFSCASSGFCQPDAGITGADCEENADCLGGLCGHFSYGRRCTERCDPWSPCPRGFQCVETSDGSAICARPYVVGRGAGCRIGGSAPASALAVLLVVLALIASVVPGRRARRG